MTDAQANKFISNDPTMWFRAISSLSVVHAISQHRTHCPQTPDILLLTYQPHQQTA